MSGVSDNMTFAHARVVLGDGTVYTPFIHPDGYVGLRCEREGKVEYLYLNPSDHTGDSTPNVFVYHGTEGDPVFDTPAHHYLVLQD
jgi:hypothetical protein